MWSDSESPGTQTRSEDEFVQATAITPLGYLCTDEAKGSNRKAFVLGTARGSCTCLTILIAR